MWSVMPAAFINVHAFMVWERKRGLHVHEGCREMSLKNMDVYLLHFWGKTTDSMKCCLRPPAKSRQCLTNHFLRHVTHIPLWDWPLDACSLNDIYIHTTMRTIHLAYLKFTFITLRKIQNSILESKEQNHNAVFWTYSLFISSEGNSAESPKIWKDYSNFIIIFMHYSLLDFCTHSRVQLTL